MLSWHTINPGYIAISSLLITENNFSKNILALPLGCTSTEIKVIKLARVNCSLQNLSELHLECFLFWYQTPNSILLKDQCIFCLSEKKILREHLCICGFDLRNLALSRVSCILSSFSARFSQGEHRSFRDNSNIASYWSSDPRRKRALTVIHSSHCKAWGSVCRAKGSPAPHKGC